jgi:ABC-type glycerol-3-phosphate transport system substrate-binding protein
VEGVWWENEASATFTEIENIRGEKKSDRNFGFLPIPKAPGKEAGDQTMFSSNSSFGFINKNCSNMELAKEFMRFLNSDAEMSKFSAKTSIPRSLNYTVSEGDKATATSFGKSLIAMRESSKVVYPYASLPLVINNAAAFTEERWFLTSEVSGKTLNNPFNAFKDGTATAAQYFNGMYSYHSGMWSTLKK